MAKKRCNYGINKTKIINIGNVYLSKLNKWKKNSINSIELPIFYLSIFIRRLAHIFISYIITTLQFASRMSIENNM